jgi:hypothetical protein
MNIFSKFKQQLKMHLIVIRAESFSLSAIERAVVGALTFARAI